jgi:hypothetical protein
MSEKRYLISEDWGIYPCSAKDTITESELKKRLQEIIDADHPMENCIDILLHGEGKEPERHVPPNGCQYEAFSSRICERGTQGCIVHHMEQPTDAWEEWVQRIPDQYNYPYWTDWAKAIQQWFMEIPR